MYTNRQCAWYATWYALKPPFREVRFPDWFPVDTPVSAIEVSGLVSAASMVAGDTGTPQVAG